MEHLDGFTLFVTWLVLSTLFLYIQQHTAKHGTWNGMESIVNKIILSIFIAEMIPVANKTR